MIILCDVDGVIANFTAAVLDVIKDVTGVWHPETAVDQWSIKDALQLQPREWRATVKGILAPGFCSEIEPYPEGIEAVKEIAKRHDLYFVTSPWWTSHTWMHERTDWLIQRFGQAQGRKIIHTSYKELIRGDALIEDKPETLDKWLPQAAAGAIAMLMDRPYNCKPRGTRNVITRCHSWAGVLQTVGALL